MAGATLSAISAAISLILMNAPTAQYRTDVIGLALLPVRMGQGANCVAPIKISGRTTAGAHAEGDDVDSGDFSTNVRKQSTLNWGEYWALASVTGKSAAVAASGGYAGGGNLIMEELNDALEELGSKLGADFYAGDHTATPPELAGCALAIDGSDDDFGGVDTGVYTSWKAGEATVATASLTLDWIRSNLFRPVKNATGANPEYVLVDGATMDVLKSKFAGNVEAVTTIIVAGMKVDVIQDLGATGIRLDGVPFIEDRHCTANTMYAFGRGAAHVEQLREPIDANASAAEIQEALLQLTGQSIQLSEVERMIMAANQSPRLVVTVEALAKTGDSRKFMLTLKLQVAWKRRNATAKATLT